MKVLFLLGDLSGSGGTERVTCDLASALAARGEEVAIVSVFGPATPFFPLSDDVATYALGLSEARGNPLRAVSISRALMGQVQRLAPDVVIAVDSVLFAFLVPFAVRRRPPLICWEHFHLNTSHGTLLRDIGRRIAARLAARIVVLTSRDTEAWRARFGRSTPVVHIPNAVPPLEAPGDGAKHSEGRYILLAAGRMTRQKGFDILLNAWARVAPTCPDWRLRIVGDGEERDVLEKQVQQLAIAPTVEMPGRIRDMACEYAAADAFVMSSRWEGLPMALLEAQQARLPTVSTDCETGPREILGESGGLLVPVEDPIGLATALERLTRDASLRASLGAAAERNITRFQMATIEQQWIAVLRDTQEDAGNTK